jgi:hypothetical protein
MAAGEVQVVALDRRCRPLIQRRRRCNAAGMENLPLAHGRPRIICASADGESARIPFIDGIGACAAQTGSHQCVPGPRQVEQPAWIDQASCNLNIATEERSA